VGEKDGCATANQKRNKEGHERCSSEEETLLTVASFQRPPRRLLGNWFGFHKRRSFLEQAGPGSGSKTDHENRAGLRSRTH